VNQSNDASLLPAAEAAARLGVKLETLYAYVSRGRLRSVVVPGTRERHYRASDIAAFLAARGGARPVSEIAGETLTPVIESSICLIDDGRLYYRGRDAVRLSDAAALEDIADLLWGVPDDRSSPAGGDASATPDAGPSGVIERGQARMAALAAAEPPPPDLHRSAVGRAGRIILRELVACATGSKSTAAPAHRLLAASWGLDDQAADLLRRCLVLLADHELNASTFVARCVASTGAGPYAAVSAALGALSGPRHGGAGLRAETMFRGLAKDGDPVSAMVGRLSHGEPVPGIGHPLYPNGDPRAVAILYALSGLRPQVRRFVGWRPNVDFALAAVATILDLPPGASLALFVVGRSAGWIAHAIEQYESGILIRPRARYTGPRPAERPSG